MSTNLDVTSSRLFDSPNSLLVSMTAVDHLKRVVKATLDAELNSNVHLLRKLGKEVELLLVHTVGTSANDDTDDLGDL